MARRKKETSNSETQAVTNRPQTLPKKRWGQKTSELPMYVMRSLYQVYHFLNKGTRQRVGLMMKLPVFIKDPLVALENPLVGIQEIEVRLETGMGHGPTSSRIAVVDFNAEAQNLRNPVIWDAEVGWFRSPEGQWLPDAPRDLSRVKDPEKYRAEYEEFVKETVKNPFFHQVNAWAVVQRVLEFYEEPQALGRPIPWGFGGNRLMVVPHAGYGENAFYDRHGKSLLFYYFGDQESPGYTCLSFDIIAHETGHAILDGIRPMYLNLSSVQTAAFHEFVGDLTAILLALHNRDIRQFVSNTTQGKLDEADILANLAPEFGEEVKGRPYLRTAFNKQTMGEMQGSLSPHAVSEVLTGAMFEILTGIASKHLAKNLPAQADTVETKDPGPKEIGSGEPGNLKVVQTALPRRVTPAQALWWATDRFRRVALQPLDLCPPCDIQFLDYAKAVIRNDVLTNPVDAEGYRQIMLEVFHRRGLCTCDYVAGEELPSECYFVEAMQIDKMDFVYHDIARVSRSRTAAYYFLNDNRKILRIPSHQDIQVVDLYETNKFGVAAERLPSEIVVEYVWQEQVPLINDPEQDLDFRSWAGKVFNLTCGGTLVFDDHGNLVSWFRKPGTEHITPAEETALRERLQAWQENPIPKNKKNRLTKQELAELSDFEVGRKRKADVLAYLSALIRRGLVGKLQPEARFSDGLRPVMASEADGAVSFEATPNFRKSDFAEEEEGWTVNY